MWSFRVGLPTRKGPGLTGSTSSLPGLGCERHRNPCKPRKRQNLPMRTLAKYEACEAGVRNSRLLQGNKSGLIELPELVLLFDPTADPEQLEEEEAQRSLSTGRCKSGSGRGSSHSVENILKGPRCTLHFAIFGFSVPGRLLPCPSCTRGSMCKDTWRAISCRRGM